MHNVTISMRVFLLEYGMLDEIFIENYTHCIGYMLTIKPAN